MQNTDTQVVTGNDAQQARNVLAAALGVPGASYTATATPPAPTPVETPAPAAAAPLTTPEVPAAAVADPVPLPPETPTPPVAPDPYALAADSLLGTPAPAAEWTAESLALFKKTFGAEDPAAYHAQVSQLNEQLNLLRTENEQSATLRTQLGSMSDGARKIVELALAGKVKEAQDYLKSTPVELLNGKPSKDIDRITLAKTYYEDKLTKDQWAALENPETDAELLSALNTRIDILSASAADKHDAILAKQANERASEATAQQDFNKRYTESAATSLSTAKNSPLSAFLDEGTVKEIQTGAFIGKYVNQDGTHTAESATLHLWATHGPKLVAAADARGYARGKSEALLEATSRQPAGPSGSAGRTSGDTPRELTEADQIRAITWRALNANA